MRIGVSQASRAPASSSACSTPGHSRGSRSSTLASSTTAPSPAVAGRGRPGRPAPGAGRSPAPPGRAHPHRSRCRAAPSAAAGRTTTTDRGEQRGAGRRRHLLRHRSGQHRHAGAAGRAPPAAGRAAVRARRGSCPDAERRPGSPMSARQAERVAGRRRVPTTSATASSAPTSWKWTSLRRRPVHGRLGARPAARRRRARSPAPASARSAPLEQRRGRRTRCGCAGRSATTHVDLAGADARARDRRLRTSRTGSTPTRSTASCSTRQRDAGVDERAEQHVAGRRPAEQSSQPITARVAPGDAGGEDACAEAVVDVHDADARRAGVEHGEQGREPAEARAVADAGRHRDHRRADEAADHRRQGALHAGDDDEAVGAVEDRPGGDQAVQPGDADVVDPLDAGAERRGR